VTTYAIQIYKLLLRHARRREPGITYAALAARVGPVHARSPKLHSALTEISVACRGRDLPCLPAIVWRADTKRPSSGYYKVAHPRARTDRARLSAWEREHEAVVRALPNYPPRL
jgi:hypothetical protein